MGNAVGMRDGGIMSRAALRLEKNQMVCIEHGQAGLDPRFGHARFLLNLVVGCKTKILVVISARYQEKKDL